MRIIEKGKLKEGSVVRKVARYGFAFLLLSTLNFQFSTAYAQKYPERRVARDGNKLYQKGEFEAAETAYKHALEANPELEDARFNLAGSLFKQKKADQATNIYMGFAADSTDVVIPRVADANFNLGNVMLSGQKLDEAIEFYKQALRLNPSDMQAKYNLAYAQKLKQQQDENQDENNDQNQDENNDQNQDQNQDQDNQDQNQDQDGNDGEGDQDQNQDQDDGEGDQDQQDGDGEGQPDEGEGDGQQDQGGEPEPDPNGQPQEVGIAPEEAEQMLEAIQGEEDKTREKMNAKEVPAVGRSGKNW